MHCHLAEYMFQHGEYTSLLYTWCSWELYSKDFVVWSSVRHCVIYQLVFQIYFIDFMSSECRQSEIISLCSRFTSLISVQSANSEIFVGHIYVNRVNIVLLLLIYCKHIGLIRTVTAQQISTSRLKIMTITLGMWHICPTDNAKSM